MKKPNLYDKLTELSQLAFDSVEKFKQKRFLYSKLEPELKNKSIVILAGPRGVGKTILLKQLLKNVSGSFYLSVDQLPPDESLFQIAKELELKYKIKNLILDEVHYNHNYETDLKAIYDFLNLKVLVTSSIALKLEELSIDLSRRAHFYQLFPFSFREFLYFEKGIKILPLTLENLLKKNWQSEHLQHAYLFKDFITGRLYPFTLDEKSCDELFKNILEKVVRVDLPQIGKLTTIDILNVEKLLAFIGRSDSEGISVTSLSKNLAITKYKVEEYLKLLNKAYLIQVVYPRGTNVTKEPKILMALPYRLIYRDHIDAVGALREDFVVETLRASGLININYLKSTRGEKTPDFIIETLKGREIVIEVGGRGKGRSQFKGINIDEKYIFVDSIDWSEKQYPLFLLSMY